MNNVKEEWDVPSVEALTEADGVEDASRVGLRNGLFLSGPTRSVPA